MACNFIKKRLQNKCFPTGKACNFIKETPIQVFSCEYREIFKNTYF